MAKFTIEITDPPEDSTTLGIKIDSIPAITSLCDQTPAQEFGLAVCRILAAIWNPEGGIDFNATIDRWVCEGIIGKQTVDATPNGGLES